MRMRKRVGEICRLTAQKMGADVEYIVHESYSSLINDNQITALVQETAEEVLGKDNVVIEEFPDPVSYTHLDVYKRQM